ncbi:MAG: class I SAM-dependent methyltransferase [Limnohabitans sp.]|nr:class I SAM-dependent methyltransferase [Limnohabitans sp.]
MEKVYFSGKLPVLQNRVYTSRDSALNAPQGELCITEDPITKLVHNSSFDPKIMIYDENYDNSVPSVFFKNYYDEIIDYLVGKYDLKNGIVLDIGCGKGTFLNRMAEKYSFINGIGVDPSHEGEKITNDGRVNFINEYFDETHLKGINKISLVLLRHTLEHIPNPQSFLNPIFGILTSKFTSANIPIFIEVPDFKWILNENAFWDFCYEHTNYFTKQTLCNTIENSNAKVTSIKNAFNNQYLWGECYLNYNNTTVIEPVDLMAETERVGVMFDENITIVIKKLKNISENSKIVIWGMATKGVIYSLHMMENGIKIDYCVDINKAKQNKFVPVSGLEIIEPDALPKEVNLSIVVMNPNYTNEIREMCKSLKIDFELLTPDITKV